jgi:hypothetical protein
MIEYNDILCTLNNKKITTLTHHYYHSSDLYFWKACGETSNQKC